MKLLQRIKCMRCCHKAQCDYLRALLKLNDEWWKEQKPKHDAAIRRADELIKRLRDET